MMERTGRRTVPQIYIGDVHVGGYDDLVALDRAGRLAPLLARAAAAGEALRRVAAGRPRPGRVKSRVCPHSEGPHHGRPPATRRRRARRASSRSTRSTSRTCRSRTRASPQSFQTQEQPQVEVGLRTRGEQIEPDVYECVLTVTLTAKVGDKTLFLVEASQAGIFTIRGVPPEHLQPVIAINCPTVLFPYIRETLADAVDARGLSAGASRADQLRGALPAAAGADAAAGCRRRPRTERVRHGAAASRSPLRRVAALLAQPMARPPPRITGRPATRRPCSTTRRRPRRSRCSCSGATRRSR